MKKQKHGIYIKRKSFLKLLVDKELSPAQCAKKANVSRGTLSNHLQNNASVSPIVAGKILKVLGCQFDDIFLLIMD